jgi:hypothetical protein
MDTVVLDTFVNDSVIKIPERFRNKRVRITITDDVGEMKKNAKPITKKIKFKIDRNMDDIIPFADIKNPKAFSRELREKLW